MLFKVSNRENGAGFDWGVSARAEVALHGGDVGSRSQHWVCGQHEEQKNARDQKRASAK